MAKVTKCKEVFTPCTKTKAEDHHHQHRKGETSVLKQDKKNLSEGKTLTFPGPLMTAKIQKEKLMRFIRWKYQDCLLNVDKPEQQESYFFWSMMELFCKENGRVIMSQLAKVLLKGYRLMKKKLECVENLEKWCVPLEQLLSTTAPKDVHRKKVIKMGDDFASRKWTYAAHICYVVAQVDLGSRKHFNLIGSEKSQSATTEVFERTEVYEYVLSLNSRLSQPHIQLFKFLHACELAKTGRFAQALNYCKSITTEVPRCKGYVKKSVEKLTEILNDGKKNVKWQKKLQQFLEVSERLTQLGFSSTQLSDFDSRYIMEELLGTGGYGSVYAGIRKTDKKKVAIKCVAKHCQNEFISIPGEKATLPLEVALMKMVSRSPPCKNVVELLEWFETSTYLILVLERPSPCIDLYEFCERNNDKLTEVVAREVMWQVVQAAEHCCKRGVLHRDIKPENILINPDTLEVKLIDFGCGEVLTENPYTTYTGTRDYTPPEWIVDKKYFGVPATVWSLGVLLFLLVSGNVPFNDDKQIVNLHVPVLTDLSDAGKNLIEQCLAKNPDHRPSLRKILNHEWFSMKSQETVQNPPQVKKDEKSKCPKKHRPVRVVSERLAQLGFSPTQLSDFDSCYTMGEMLGKGEYGTVYAGIRKTDNKKVAIKCVARENQNKCISIPGEKATLPLEVALMKMVSKPPRCTNVVELLDWFETSTYLILVLERPSPCIDLHEFCKRFNFKLPEEVAREVMWQVVRVAEHCYKRGVLHHDIKPDNILINPDTLEVKLIDFGCGDVVTEKPYRRYIGIWEFRPPEWILDKEYFGVPATIWSLGVLLYLLVSGNVPFNDDKQIVNLSVPVISELSDVGQDLTELCLEKNPDHRPSFRKILNHEWFSMKREDKVQISKNPPQVKKDEKSKCPKKHRTARVVSERLAQLGFSPTQLSDFDSRYIMGEMLGTGGYGSVYAGIRKTDKTKVAIKCVARENQNKCISIPGEKATLPLEVALMKMVSKPPRCENVVELLDWFETSTYLILVLERPSPCIDLYEYSKCFNFKLPEEVAREVMWQVVRAAEHCYKRGVLHHDIKPDNILINPDTLEVMLIDFGCGDVVTEKPYRRYIGILEFRPPEWILNKEYFGVPATIWGLGVLLYLLVSGSVPFEDDEQIVKDCVPVLSDLSPVGQNLMELCLEKNPDHRPSFRKILNHDWFFRDPQDMVQISKNPPRVKKDEKSKYLGKCRPSMEVSKRLAQLGFSSTQLSDFDSRYILEELLGKVTYGAVYAGIRKTDKKKVAIKCVDREYKKKGVTIPGEKATLPLEVALMKMVSKPPCCENVVELLDWFETSTYLILVLERPSPCIDLLEFCKRNNRKLTEEVAREVMWQVVRAAEHCRERGVLHRDIKPVNILINPDTLEVKLTDFGCGDLLTENPYTSYAGTRRYRPPEWIVDKKYFGVPATVWSLGVLLYLLLSGTVPFNDDKQIVNRRVPVLTDLSDVGQNLMELCLEKNPDHRPSFRKILNHDWFFRDPQDTVQLSKNLPQGKKDVKSKCLGKHRPSMEESRRLAWLGFSPTQLSDFDSRYTMGEMLGTGAYGSVYAGIRKADKKKVAIKCVDREYQKEGITIPGEKATLPLEVALMKMVSKPPRCENVVELLDWFETSTYLILVLERPSPCIDLYEYSKRFNFKLPEEVAREVMWQVVRAAEHCYKRGVLHHDIKPDNILINPDTLEVMLIDFGCGDVVTEKPYRRYVGILEFRPPEWILNKEYLGVSATIWGLGVLLYLLVSGSVPYEDDEQIVKDRVPVLSELSPVGQNLMELCLEKNPDRRPSFRKILTHEWFFRKPQDMVQISKNPPRVKKNKKSKCQEKHRPSVEVSERLAWLEFSSTQLSKFSSRYIMEELLGTGGYGAVYAGIRKADKKKVAIKCVASTYRDEYIRIPGEKATLPLEVALMKMVSKPPRCKNVVELLDWFETSAYLILVLERPSPCIDLHEFCERNNHKLTEAVAQKVMWQVVRAAEHCCKCGVLHRDIKPENILINPDTLEVKLIDFGCGDVLKKKPYTSYAGTRDYVPPEWFVDNKYSGVPATVWSLGVVLYLLLSGNVPFNDDKQIVNLRVPVLTGLSDAGQDLIEWCLAKTPDRRPSFRKILNHKWFTAIRTRYSKS